MRVRDGGVSVALTIEPGVAHAHRPRRELHVPARAAHPRALVQRAALAIPHRPERLPERPDLHDAGAEHEPLAEHAHVPPALACAPVQPQRHVPEVDRPAGPVAAIGGRARHDPLTLYVAVMRAGAVQLSSTADVDRNLAAADRLVRAAARDGAELVVLPEKWPALGPPEVLRAGADRRDDVLAWARAIARELAVDLVAGSMSHRSRAAVTACSD